MALNKWVNTSSSIRYIPPGKVLCYITNKLRKETPEEHVRQRVARSLVEEYGYSKQEIEINFPIWIGSKRHPVDITIFHPNTPPSQENIYLIIETKKEAVKPSDQDYGIGQLKSYMGACVNCKFGMWTNGLEKHCFQKVLVEERYKIEDVIDIPPKGKSIEEYDKPDFTQLRPATELRSVFRRCHDYIHGNQGLPKDIAFHELLKVIFCKVYDERESAQIRFYITNTELKSTTGQIKVKQDRIDPLFNEVKTRYSHIFKPEEKIELQPRVLAFIVGQLQYFSLLQTETDVKGDAYEAIVGANLRGDRGEFFTPRNVCKMAVESLFYTYPKERWHSLRIIDPACGTGGFLIAVINFLNNYYFKEQELKKWKDEDEAIKRAEERAKEYCNRYLYAVDFNPLLVRTSQMNEVMHGNGSVNLFAVNSLLPPGEWQEIAEKLNLETFDLLFTNPPFGAEIPISDPHILQQYDIAHVWQQENGRRFVRTEKLRASVPPEQLFIERSIQFLKPHGKLAIVLPDSILSNPGLAFIRYWILRKAKVIASIDLPRETFLPYVGTKTSILFLEKKTNEEIRLEEETGALLDYEVFMAIAQKVGQDRRGNQINRRTPEGEEIIKEVEKTVIRIDGKTKTREKIVVPEPIKDDDLPEITESFRNWLSGKVYNIGT